MTTKKKGESILIPMIEADEIIPTEMLPKGGPAGMFYWSDFAISCQEMSRDSIGAYIMLLCHHGNRGSLPADAMALPRLACGMVPDEVLKKFVRIKTTDGDRLVNLRLLVELERYQKYIKRQSDNGKRKWEKANSGHENNAMASAAGNPTEPAMASATTDAKSMPPYPYPIPKERQCVSSLGITSQEEREVEPQPGFPKTLDEAKSMGVCTGIPDAIIEEEYHRAVGRGYADSRGVLIRKWAGYLQGVYAARRSRQTEDEKRHTGGGGGKKNGYHRPYRDGDPIPEKNNPPDGSDTALLVAWRYRHFSLNVAPGETAMEHKRRVLS